MLVLSVLDPDDGAGLADHVEKWLTKPIEDGDALIGAVEQLVGGDEPARRVLVVEDDDDLAQILAASLRASRPAGRGRHRRWPRPVASGARSSPT